MTLASLAARYGVARSYRTDRGELVTVGRDTVVAVLDALGVDTAGRGGSRGRSRHVTPSSPPASSG